MGTIGSEAEFYSIAGDTKENDQLEEMKIGTDMEGENYEESRARFEEIKKLEEEETNEIASQPFDVEAENRALEHKLNKALEESTKVDLVDKLKKDEEEAKGKGKKAVRTFDMLKKAINGDPEQRKKEEE